MKTTHHCLTCGRDITPAQWPGLKYLDTQRPPFSAEDPRPMRQEWRKCTCGNSLQIDLADPEYMLFAWASDSARAALFTVRAHVESEEHKDQAFTYGTIEECLGDAGLQALLEDGAVCSAWSGDNRVTRDTSNSGAFRRQLIANASTILRGLAT